MHILACCLLGAVLNAMQNQGKHSVSSMKSVSKHITDRKYLIGMQLILH